MIGVGLIWIVGLALVIPLLGMVLKWVLENFLTAREASIASLSAMLGGLPSSLLDAARFDYVPLTEAIGLLIGLGILWWCLFKRKAINA